MKSVPAKPRAQLDRSGWIDGAIEALADEGLSGMRVEALAKRFGVTKGSFYWHFRDRQDLFDAMLQTWKDGRIRDIDKQRAMPAGNESEQLQQIIEIYSANRNRKGISIELAVRDWARRDPQASAVVEEVDTYRLESACKLFVATGLSDSEAKSRSLLLYAYVFGQSLMAYDRFDPKIIDIKQWISRYIVVGETARCADTPDSTAPR
ncbi:MAG: TetR/AcrR family transcriptional regulator [Propionivibrio sp.]|nr:TetR/AcrR family transcriptional regulator [Propionivibrio sp.]